MATRVMGKLNTLAVGRLSRNGMHSDGGGLYLSVRENSRTWIFRYRDRITGKLRDMGLGPAHDVTLAEAREKARVQRKLLQDGRDPLAEKREAIDARKRAAAARMTFAGCVDAYLRIHSSKWRNDKHRAQWRSTLETYANPVIGTLSVASIDTALVRKVLEPIWISKHETATRVRQRMEAILSWATVGGYRSGENPARWKGHLDQLLPAIPKFERVKHHAALDWREAGAFVAELRTRVAPAARALEFLILTAARTGEVIGATWGEFDLDRARWVIPAARMKGKRAHVSPLSPRAVALLRDLGPGEGDAIAFTNPDGKPLSNMAMATLLKRMARTEITVHGFRSSFRDWAGEATAYPREVIEMALAHRVGNATEAAYARGDLFEKRQRLMRDWASFLDRASATSSGAITPIREVA